MLMKLTVGGVTFTVGDETYIGTHRTVPVSFMTVKVAPPTVKVTVDCKFCQNLQLVMVAINAIWLTIIRGVIEIKPSTPWGMIENRNF